jgi:hypothetical protein
VGPWSGPQALFDTNPNIQDAAIIRIPADRKEEDSRAKRIHALAGIKANSQKTPAPMQVAAQASTQKTVHCETALGIVKK